VKIIVTERLRFLADRLSARGKTASHLLMAKASREEYTMNHLQEEVTSFCVIRESFSESWLLILLIVFKINNPLALEKLTN